GRVLFRHQQPENALLAEGPHRQCGTHRTVDTPGHAQHQATATEVTGHGLAYALANSFNFRITVECEHRIHACPSLCFLWLFMAMSASRWRCILPEPVFGRACTIPICRGIFHAASCSRQCRCTSHSLSSTPAAATMKARGTCPATGSSIPSSAHSSPPGIAQIT